MSGRHMNARPKRLTRKQKEALSALAGIRKWNYVNGILKAWKNEGVKTIGDVQSRDERRNPPAGQQQKPSAKDDYDAIFGGLG